MGCGADGRPTLREGETDDAPTARTAPPGGGDDGERVTVDEDSNIIRGED